MRRAMLCAGLWGIIAIVGVGRSASASDWPQFKRDAARTGDAADEALTFPMSRVTAVRFPSPIYASPAAVDSRVYVQDVRGHVACIDAAANKVLWVREIGGVANHSSPALAEGKVFVGSSAGYLAILDAKDGTLLAKVPGAGGVIAAPAVANGAVYFSTLEGKLHKIDFSGKVRWTFAGATGSCLDFAVRGDRILFFGRSEKVGEPYRENTVKLFILRDKGDEVELLASPWAPTYPTSGIVFAGDNLCAFHTWRAEEGTPYLLTWDADFKIKTREWKSNLGMCDSRAVPSCRDGRVFVVSKTGVMGWDADGKSGGDWGFGGSPQFGTYGLDASPALSKEHLVIGSNEGQLLVYPLNPGSQGRQPLWAYKISSAGKANGGILSSPAVSGGRVYFGGEDGILYGLGQGAEVAVVVAPAPAPAGATTPEGGRATAPGQRLTGPEWVSAGGDMGFSFVSPDTHLKPPFQVKWRSRIWGVRKGGVVVADGKVFVPGRSGQLTAIDAESGEVIWNTNNPYAFSFCPPTYAEGKVVVYREPNGSGKDQSGLWCHDAKTGELLWHVPGPRPTAVYGSAAEGIPVFGGKAFACWHDGAGGLNVAAWSLADGKPVWSRHHENLSPVAEKTTAVVNQGAIGDGKWFCSFNYLTSAKPPDRKKGGATIAVNPENGDVVWQNSDVFIDASDRYYMGRVSYRNKTVVVFQQGMGSVALDSETGKRLWTGGRIEGYAVPLSDAYLNSQGKSGISSGAYCGANVYDNGFWYGQSSFNSAVTIGRTMTGTPPRLTDVWTWLSMGRSCATAAPAYGRLYFCSNEGVVYCFENSGN